MPINEKDIVWDAPAIDESDIVWDSPSVPTKRQTFPEYVGSRIVDAGKSVFDAVKRVGDYVTSGEQNEEIESPVAATKRVVGEVIDTAKKLPSIGKRGYVGGQFASALNEDNPNPETLSSLYSEQQKIGKGIAPTAQEKRTSSGMGVFENFAANPISFITEVGVSSLAGMAPEAIKSAPRIVAGSVTTGGLLGAGGLGAPTGGLGAPAGAVGGATAGLAASLPLVAYQSSAVQKQAELFVTELQQRGVDVNNPDALKAAFSNPALINDIKSKVALPSAITGFFDGLSALAGGNVESAVAKRMALSGVGKAGRRVAGEAADFGVQSAAGMSGEGGSQLAYSGGITDPNAVFAEGLAETPIQSLATRGIKGLAGMANTSMQLSGALNQPMQNNPQITDNAVLASMRPGQAQVRSSAPIANVTPMAELLRVRGVEIAPQPTAADAPLQEVPQQPQIQQERAQMPDVRDIMQAQQQQTALPQMVEQVARQAQPLPQVPEGSVNLPESALATAVQTQEQQVDLLENITQDDSSRKERVRGMVPNESYDGHARDAYKNAVEVFGDNLRNTPVNDIYEKVPLADPEMAKWISDKSKAEAQPQAPATVQESLTVQPETAKKEPWQMTKSAMVNHLVSRNSEKINVLKKELEEKLSTAPDVSQGNLTRKSKRDSSGLNSRAEWDKKNGIIVSQLNREIKRYESLNEGFMRGDKSEEMSDFHKNHVQKALSEGKPVPPEVLADYPDLATNKPENNPSPKEVEEIRTKIAEMRRKAHNFTKKLQGVVLPNGVVKGRVGGAKGDAMEKAAQKLFREAGDLEDHWYGALYPDKISSDDRATLVKEGMPVIATNKPDLSVAPVEAPTDVQDEYARAGEAVIVHKGKGRREYRGEITRTLKGIQGNPVYEVKPEGMDTTFRVDGEDVTFDKAEVQTKKVSQEQTAFEKQKAKKATEQQDVSSDARKKKAAFFRDSADRMQKQIDAKRDSGVSKQNPTARRARIAANMAADADDMARVQSVMRGMADDIENDRLPKALWGVTSKALIEEFRPGRDFSRTGRTITAADWSYYGKNERIVKAGIKHWSTFNAAKEAIDNYVKPKSPEQLRKERIKRAEDDLIGVKIEGFFPTPKRIAADMVEMADIREGMSVLEPSAGKGDIAEAIKESAPDAKLSVVEQVYSLSKLLEEKGFNVVDGNFLLHKGKYDRIIMNPPFEKGQDMQHVQHAYSLLNDGGRIVSIMGEGAFFRNDKQATEFREWLDSVGGTSEKMEAGSFTGADAFRQTGTATRMVVIDKAKAVEAKPTPKKEASQPEKLNVHDNIKAQLKSAGIYTDEQVEAGALFVSEFYAAKAKGLGITPESLYERVPYKIKRGDMPKGDVLKQSKLPTTIDIDGKQRSTVNSTGNQIAQTEEGVRNFWSWFGESEVVDKQGLPLVVYHGTNADFNTFEPTTPNYYEITEGVYFFTDKEDVAGKFGEHVIPVYLNIDNPTKLNGNVGRFNTWELNDDSGNYGWIVTDSDTGGGFATEYAVENPTQIKSAIGNSGEFDVSNPNILKQGSPIFYSQLSRAIESAPDKIFSTGKSVSAWLKSNAGKLGVKKEELYWTGVTEWLETQGKVSKADVMAYLDANGVQVREVMKGSALSKRDLSTRRDNDGSWSVISGDGVVLESGLSERRADDIVDNYWNGDGNTKYQSYQLSGGENYRELLLTLPKKEPLVIAEMYRSGDDIRAKESAFVSAGFSKESVQSAAEFIEEHGSLEAALRFQDTLIGRGYGYTGAQKESGALLRSIISAHKKKVAAAKISANKENFKSSHWDEPNIIAHIRFNDRTDASGKRVLFIEEVQSDWGQDGKKKGFVVNAQEEELKQAEYEKSLIKKYKTEAWRTKSSEQENVKWDELSARIRRAGEGLPQAPFVTDTKAWTSLAIKRMIRYAAENGYDKVAFVNSEQSAERYDLSKLVDYIKSERTRMGHYIDISTTTGMINLSVDESGKVINELGNGNVGAVGKGLDEVIGKELAQKILNNKEESARYEGVDLKVGGEGMKAFYDKIVPQVASELVRKFGAKMERVGLDDTAPVATKDRNTGRFFLSDTSPQFDTREEAYAWHKQNSGSQIGFAITEPMRDSVLRGQQLFQSGKSANRGGFNPKTLTTILTKDSDFSTFLHETGHFYLDAQAQIVRMDGASSQIKDDMNTLLDWFGVKDLAAWDKLSFDGKRKHHEAFAYNFELYLSEGVAPNAKMKAVFERFKEWLTQVYKSIKTTLNKVYREENGVDLPILTGDVRKVMDRMVSQEAFDKAKEKKVSKPESVEISGIRGKQEDIIANGKEYGKIEYRVVEKGDIVSSHDPFTFRENPKYPQERQNRDYSLLDVRSKAEDAIDGITDKKFKEVLYPTIASDAGIPVINEAGVVLSGNNRTFAIQRGYNSNQIELSYRSALLNTDMQQFGINPDDVSRMKEPVLVRVMSNKEKEGDFVIDSNINKVKTLSSAEIRKHYAALPDAKKQQARKGIAGIYEAFNKSEDARINTFLGNLHVGGLPVKVRESLLGSNVLGESDIQDGQLTSVGIEKVKMLAVTLLNEGMNVSNEALAYLSDTKEGNANLDKKFDAAIGDMFRLRDEQPDVYRDEMLDLGQALNRAIDVINHPELYKASTKTLTLQKAARGASVTDEPLTKNGELYLHALLSPTLGSLKSVVADKASMQEDLFSMMGDSTKPLARPGAAVGDLKREGNMVEELPTKEMKPHAGLEKREAVIAEDAGFDEGYTARIKTPFYEVISNVQTVNEAIKLIERYDDIMEVLDVIRDEKNDIPGHVRIGVAEVVVRRLSEAYRKTKDSNILEKQNEFMEWELNYGENTARALQAMSMYSRLTPEGFLIQVKKGIKKSKDNHYKKNKKDVDALLAAIKEGDAFAARRSSESEEVRRMLGKLGDEEQRLWGQYVSWFSESMDIVAMARRTTREYGALEEFARKVKNLFKEKLPDIKLEKPDRMNSISLVRSQIANFKELRQAWRDAREELIARSKGDEKIAALERLIPQELGTPFTTADIRKVMREMGYFNVKNIARTWGEDRKSLTNTIIEALVEDQNTLTSEEYRFTVKALKAEIDGIVDAEKQRMADYRQKLADVKKRKDDAVKAQQERTGGKSIDVADRVARKYLQFAKEKRLTPPLQMLFRDMVSALSSDFKKEEGTSVKPDYSRAVYHAIRNAGKYIDAWDAAKQKVLERFPDKSDEINKAFDDITSHIPSSAIQGLIREQMKEQQTKLSDVVRQYFSEKQGAYSKTLADAIASKFPDFTMEEVTMLSNAVMKEFDAIAKQARFSALKSLANRGNRAAKAIKPEWQRVIEMAKLGALSKEEFYNVVAKTLKLPVYSTEIANKIMELGKIIEDAPDGLSKRIAILNMTKYISAMHGFKTIDFSKGVFYANILSGVNTSIVNMLDTYDHVLGEVSLRSKLNPEFTAFVFSRLFDGLKTGRFDAILEFRYGVSAFDDKWAHSKGFMEVAKFGQKGGVPIGNKYVKALLESKPMTFANLYKYVSRILTAQDLIAQRGAKEAESAVIAYDMAVAKGMRGTDAILEAKNILALNDIPAIREQARSEGYDGVALESRVLELIDELRPTELNEAAQEFAGYATYNHEPEGFLGSVSKKASQLGAEFPKFQFLVPFTKIVANVTNRKLDYFTPVALWRASKADGEVARATLYKKAMIGVASVVGLAMLEAGGLVVVHGAGSDDWRKRKQMQANGWMPYSLEIGGYFVDYRLLPVSFMLAAYGNAQDMKRYGIADDLSAGRLLAYSVLMTVNVISAQNFLSGMSELFATITAKGIGGVKKLERISTSIATGLVFPSLARDAYRMFDSSVYTAEGVWGNVVRNVPYIGALSGADKELNVLAQPVSVSFFRSVKTKQADPLWTMIWEKKINIPVVSKTTQFDGKVLTPKQFMEYQILYGTDMRQYLQSNITVFSRMSSDDINKDVLDYSKQAKKDAKLQLGIDID